jgi:hypothetical protein
LDLLRVAATVGEALPLLPDAALDEAFPGDDFLRCLAGALTPTDVPTNSVRMIKNKGAIKTRCCFLMFQSLS